MRQAPADWAALSADVRSAIDDGVDPADPRAQALARRWQGLIDEFTGGDPGIAQSLKRLWEDQGSALAAQHKMSYDPAAAEYMGKALAVLKGSA
jgi:hypothetical protein